MGLPNNKAYPNIQNTTAHSHPDLHKTFQCRIEVEYLQQHMTSLS